MEAAFDGAPLTPVEGEVRAPASGEHRLTVVAIDAAGNRSAARTVTVFVDAVGPRVDLTIDPPPVPAAGGGAPWLSPGSRAIAVAGDGDSAVRSLVLEDSQGRSVSTHPVAEMTLRRPGDIRLRARAVDGVGNPSEEIVFEGRVDARGPQGEIFARGPQVEAPSGLVIGPGSRLAVRFADAGSGVESRRYFLDGRPVGVEEWSPAALPAGAHELGAEAVDRVGNRTVLPPREIHLDKEGPRIVWRVTSPGVDSAEGSTYFRSPVSVDLEAEDELAGVQRLEWSVDGTRWTGSEAGSESLVIDGAGLSLRAVDRVGNRRQATASWRLDLSPPRPRLRGPFDGDPPPGSVLRLPQGSSLEAWAEDDGSGVARQQVSLRRGHRREAPHRYRLETRGTYRLEVSAEDRLGNEMREYWWVKVTRRGAGELSDVR